MARAKSTKVRRGSIPIYRPRRGRPLGWLAREIAGLVVGGCLLIDDIRLYDTARSTASNMARQRGWKLSTALHPQGQGFGIWRVS